MMPVTNSESLLVDEGPTATRLDGTTDERSARIVATPASLLEARNYYRADIDGLRGIAVSLVILFHAFPKLFGNGFLGVDIFFVISGFVVTQSIERKLSDGFGQGLLNFYGHRVKRILPALYLNVLVTIGLSCLFIPPSELRSIFKTAASAVAGMSNLALLIARFDYFSPDLSLNPIVHTWSLGAEEQFYLLFPSVLIAAFYINRKIGRTTRTGVVLLLAALSIAYWIYAQFQAPVVAFYNTIARLWELLVGAIVYLERTAILRLIERRRLTVLAFLGAALVLVGLAPLSERLAYFRNIFAVVGAGMLLISGASPGPMRKLLAVGALVWIGRLSYSLYLWHYPLLTLAGWNLDVTRPLIVAGVLSVIVAISALSYAFVELPLRYSKIASGKAIMLAVMAGAGSLLLIGALYWLPPSRIYLGHAEAYAGLWPGADVPLTRSLSSSQRDCHLEYRDTLAADAFERCSTKRTDKPFVYLVGNSHAQHLIPMLDAVADSTGYGYSALTISNCRLMSATQVVPAINFRYELCKDYFDRSLEFISRNARRGDVVLVGARSLMDEPTSTETSAPSNVIVNGSRLSMKEAYLKSKADFDSFLTVLRSLGVAAVFVGPTPQFDLPATMCVPEWFRSQRDCSVPITLVQNERAAYLNSISTLLTANPNAFFLGSLAGVLHCVALFTVFQQRIALQGSPPFVGFRVAIPLTDVCRLSWQHWVCLVKPPSIADGDVIIAPVSLQFIFPFSVC